MITIKQREEIKKAYEKAEPRLMSGEIISPYSLGIDWMGKMSPIENNVWSAIGALCLPFFPQYPIGKFFVDFAWPYEKVAIEVDSIKWHRDHEKDKWRQREIEKRGWEVIRIPSSLTYKIKDDYKRPNCICEPVRHNSDTCIDWKRFFSECAEGILLARFRPGYKLMAERS